ELTIRFGLEAIKHVGGGPVEEIISAREKDGQFKSLADLARRVNIQVLNKRTLEALAWSGALDDLGQRKQMAENFQVIVDFAKKAQKISMPDDQSSLFGDEAIDTGNQDLMLPFTELGNRHEKMVKEKELLGIYVSENPLKKLKSYFQNRCSKISSLQDCIFDQNGKSNKDKKIGGMITELKIISTKKGEQMCFARLESWCLESIELVIFPSVWAENKEVFQNNLIAIFEGKMNQKDGELKFLVEKVTPLDFETADKKSQLEESKTSNGEHYILVELPIHFSRSQMLKIRTVFDKHAGPIPVTIMVGKSKVPSKCTVDGSRDFLEKLKEINGVKAKKLNISSK
ncbi:MAG: hypothetical protein NTZ80_00540, partial [Patescibacteria group bacterium]|nr:hypothetical protein [Patescibacteria group bacterium]